MDSLKDYEEHVTMYPNSLIARIYGIFQVDMDGIQPVSLLLMANTIQMANDRADRPRVFDLKGSWNNRIVTDNSGKQTMKDRNLLNLIKKTTADGILQFDKKDIKEIN